MTINLDTEVMSRFDPATNMCIYAITRSGRTWTVQIPRAELDRHRASRDLRRSHLAQVLKLAMAGPADGET